MTLHEFPSTVVKLKRIRKSDEGVFGYLTLNGNRIAVTCEDPDNHNKPNASCIPPGNYLCIPHNGPKFKNVWEVTGVPGRKAILIHAGNTIADTHGCILVGQKFGFLGKAPAVLNSMVTINQLRQILPDTFTLIISEEYA